MFANSNHDYQVHPHTYSHSFYESNGKNTCTTPTPASDLRPGIQQYNICVIFLEARVIRVLLVLNMFGMEVEGQLLTYLQWGRMDKY